MQCDASQVQYWLFKSEPDTFSIEDLASADHQTTSWEGVRNYQARNFLRDNIHVGDGVLFYHSSCKVPAIVGTAEVVKSAYPDKTALDPESPYYDPRATKDSPRWYCVDIQLKSIFTHPISLEQLKAQPPLSEMQVTKRGNRLSITPVTPQEWRVILGLG